MNVKYLVPFYAYVEWSSFGGVRLVILGFKIVGIRLYL
jgi:hypothetical protein